MSTPPTDTDSKKGEQYRPVPSFTTSQDFLVAIINSSEDAIGENLDGIVTSWNPAASRIFGYSAQEIVGSPIDILHPPGASLQVKMILEIIRRGQRTEPLEGKRRRNDGMEIDVSISISPIRTDDGSIVGAAKIVRDITDRKRAEVLDRRAEKLRVANSFATALAHEINNPLSAVTNLIYLLRQEDLSQRGANLLSETERQLKRLTRITAQALVSYKETSKARSCQISTLLDEAVELHADRIRHMRVMVRKEYEDVPLIDCQVSEISQVFAQIVSNALDSLSNGGALWLRIRCSHLFPEQTAALRVTIADNGAGIAKRLRHRLFEPFFTTNAEVRIGLGLWMCKQVVERPGGRISIRSRQDLHQHGTVYSVSLKNHEVWNAHY